LDDFSVKNCIFRSLFNRKSKPGEVETDEEGIRTMTVLGENMAWLLKKLP
jgi:hypothetical protein